MDLNGGTAEIGSGAGPADILRANFARSPGHEKCPHDIKPCRQQKHSFLKHHILFRAHAQNNPADGFHFFSLAIKGVAIDAPG